MPVIFKVKNKRKLLSFQEVLSVSSMLQLIPGLSQYSFDNNMESWDFLNAKLSELEALWLGVETKSSLGFYVSYDVKSKEYVVELSYYATEIDWTIALRYLSALAEKVGNPISIGAETLTATEIIDYQCEQTMLAGLRNLLERIESDEIYLKGIKRPIILGNKMRELLIGSDSPLDALGELIYNTQYPNVYVHQQTFHYNSGEKTIYGNYSIGEELKVVLPSVPFVEDKNNHHLVGHPLTHWTMTVTLLNEAGDYELYKVCEYNSFVQQIPSDKCQFIDDNFMIVNALTKVELDDIIEKSELLDKYGQFIS
ncbi:DUF4299 family protein [Streptococcus plurextorum]|uniref:DUF4299 family protein n=1 Tax=Streptococcus plurextorum TaxID=456876 RepID=UPI00041BDD23|nr:DUF4299 family protein [Streptococcus plurextorum]